MTNDQKAFCTQCGATLEPDSVFCSECGNNVAEPDPIYNSGPDALNAGLVYGSDDIAKTKATGRMMWIYILLIGYLLIGLILAFTGILYDYFVGVIGSDPALIEIVESSGISYDYMVSLTDAMFTFGILTAVSVVLVAMSLILCIMKTKHMAAVILCAAGSLVLMGSYLSGIQDGIFLGFIGLLVTYFLYTTGPAFLD